MTATSPAASGMLESRGTVIGNDVRRLTTNG